uniref:EF-hand domain-containing protein n=1 Tax=Romanomermis culicivorax TaxID=13658 RepID=A0A915JIS2_ROMCU
MLWDLSCFTLIFGNFEGMANTSRLVMIYGSRRLFGKLIDAHFSYRLQVSYSMFSIFSSPKFSSSLSSSSSSANDNNQQENQSKKLGKCSKSSSFSSLRRRVNPLRAEVPSSSSMDTIGTKTTANNAIAAGPSGIGTGSANGHHHHHHEHHQESSSSRKMTTTNVLKLRPSGCSEQQLTPPSTIADNAVGIQTTSPLSKKSIERYSKALKMDRKTLQHYYEAFRLFDKNRDGSISTGELRIVMHSLGLDASDTDLKTLIDGFDENEFQAMLKEPASGSS